MDTFVCAFGEMSKAIAIGSLGVGRRRRAFVGPNEVPPIGYLFTGTSKAVVFRGVVIGMGAGLGEAGWGGAGRDEAERGGAGWGGVGRCGAGRGGARRGGAGRGGAGRGGARAGRCAQGMASRFRPPRTENNCPGHHCGSTDVSNPIDKRFILGTTAFLRSWLLTSGPMPFRPFKPFSCKACLGIPIQRVSGKTNLIQGISGKYLLQLEIPGVALDDCCCRRLN